MCVGYMEINMKNFRKFNFQTYDTTTSGVFHDPALICKPGFLQDGQGVFQCHILNGDRRLWEVLRAP